MHKNISIANKIFWTKKSPNYRQNVLGDKEDVNGVASNLGHAEEDIQETSDEHRLGNIMNGHFQYYIVIPTMRIRCICCFFVFFVVVDNDYKEEAYL